MSLFKDWTALLEGNGASDEFWNQYLAQEKDIYEAILTEKTTQLNDTVAAFGEKHDLSPTLAVGFLDGINTSLTEALDLDSFTEETAFDATIDFEKLYFNMHKAKAEWLYSISAWDDILTKERQAEIKKDYNRSVTVVIENKIGRNDPCPCGSGKKFKKCCIDKGIY
ncbi:SEC-C domain-containing protein [Fusibacter paucivorans]|uniref:SEC-C domain-containing protein n=1 Tax=Fusibacter paucivorans TaxID=76009 RepID=A0ABS5PP43_9FIRM|nr:SEC-C metal-binding domain-containing protein [Fusibacter paucivorans]MBS7526116.1 SEC-C domain-containing protein [Fusibacter paucivorans]